MVYIQQMLQIMVCFIQSSHFLTFYFVLSGDQYDHSSICLTRDVLNSHLYGSRRSTDGKHYIFAVQIAKNDINNDFILLSNDETYLALPTYLIVYKRLKNFH
jgi:hypothetical protein